MDELGCDVSVVYPSTGLAFFQLREEESRTAADIEQPLRRLRRVPDHLSVPLFLEEPAELEGVAIGVTRGESPVKLNLSLRVGSGGVVPIGGIALR